MCDCKTILSDLVRSIAGLPDRVLIRQIDGMPLAFEVRVAPRDYEIVISRIDAIKTLTASLADLPPSRPVLVHVTLD